MELAVVADNGCMNGCREFRAERPTCDETRSTRLHYQLRCLLPNGHDGVHQWTPELLSGDGHNEAATG